MPTEAAQRVGPQLNFVNILRVVNVGLLYGRYFEKEACHLSGILPGKLLRLYLNFYENEMLTKTKVCSYFTAFLYNGQQPASDLL